MSSCLPAVGVASLSAGLTGSWGYTLCAGAQLAGCRRQGDAGVAGAVAMCRES
jgi:hypothetical protein